MGTELEHEVIDQVVYAVCNEDPSEIELYTTHSMYSVRVPPVVPKVLDASDFTGVTVSEALQLVYSCLFSIAPIQYNLRVEHGGY